MEFSVILKSPTRQHYVIYGAFSPGVITFRINFTAPPQGNTLDMQEELTSEPVKVSIDLVSSRPARAWLERFARRQLGSRLSKAPHDFVLVACKMGWS